MSEKLSLSQNKNTFQYINLNSLDFFYEIKTDTFDPSQELSAKPDLNSLLDKKNRKLEKSMNISTISSKSKTSKLSKKAKKNEKKRKIKQKENELELAKKDSKNGIYSIKPQKNEKDKKKQGQKIKGDKI